jgi:adenylosuccinate lyase
MVGRTHGVQALPITFGHKCAIWLDEVSRHHERMRQIEPRLFVGMLIGAVGTQASLGAEARELEEMTCATLDLAVPDISWGPARDRFAEYANLLAMVGATFSKIGNELRNLQRNEFAEVEEGFSEGKLGSSTMPHKRNPTSAENVAGLSRTLRYNAAMMTEAMVQEHERDGIAWKTEWKALPECCLIAGAILFQSRNLLAGLRVDQEAMAANLDMMRGYLLSERVMLEL